MAAKVTLSNPTIRGAIKDCAPAFKLADALRRFVGVNLGHFPVVHQVSAKQSVVEVCLPTVSIIRVAKRRCHATFGHNRVGFTQQ